MGWNMSVVTFTSKNTNVQFLKIKAVKYIIIKLYQNFLVKKILIALENEEDCKCLVKLTTGFFFTMINIARIRDMIPRHTRLMPR